MNAISWLETLNGLGFKTAWVLLSLLWQSSILLAAAALLTYVLRKRRASVRHTLWIVALLAVPALPLLAWVGSSINAPQAEIPVMPSYSAPPMRAPLPKVELYEPPSESPPPPVALEAEEEREFSLLAYPWALALLVYSTGLILFLSLVAAGRLRIGRWIRKGTVVKEARVLGAFEAAWKHFGLRRDFVVVESEDVQAPMTIRTFRPVVLLPTGLCRNLSESELQAVAIHEMAHIKRNDPLLLTLASFVRAVLFFHPLIWLACRQISLLAEEVADDTVLEATGEALPYARMLARLAEDLTRRSLSTELAAGIVLSKSAFLRRVEAILSDRRDQIRKLSRLALVFTILATLVSLALATALPLGEKSPPEAPVPPEAEPAAQRWDLRMIEEAPIWDYLLVKYGYAAHAKYWPERKAALQTIVNEVPDSRWADDAALILACGKADFEGDANGAVAALREVIKKYPDGHTIVDEWSPPEGCRLDQAWLMWVGGLVFLNPDRTIGVSRPFDRDGKISQEEREILAYFDHLEKHPKLTIDVAQCFIADKLWRQGKLAGATAELEAIIARHPDLAAINAADRQAAVQADGYLIGHVPPNETTPVWRPEYDAYLWLSGLYQAQGQNDNAVATAVALAEACSADGWYYRLNRRVGDRCAENGRWTEAERQYRLGVQGYRQVVADRAARQEAAEAAGLISKPPDFVESWEKTILEVWEWKAVLEVLENLVQEAQAKGEALEQSKAVKEEQEKEKSAASPTTPLKGAEGTPAKVKKTESKKAEAPEFKQVRYFASPIFWRVDGYGKVTFDGELASPGGYGYWKVYYSAPDIAQRAEWYDWTGVMIRYALFKYDHEGNISEIDAYKYGGVPWIRAKFSYDEQGRVAEKVHLGSNGKTWRIKHKYDAQGKKSEVASYDSKEVLQGTWKLKFDENGRTVESNYYDAKGKLKVSSKSKYDQAGRRVESWVWDGFRYPKGKLGERTTQNKYNDQGWLIERATYDASGKLKDLEKYKYAEDGRLLEKFDSSYTMDGGTRTFAHKYDDARRIVESTTHFDGRLREATQYNEFQRRKESIRYDEKGQVRDRCEYEYDEKGKLVKTRRYRADGGLLGITKYDEFLRLKEIIRYDEEGKIESRWEYEYDEEGRQTQRRFGGDGKLQEILEYDYDEQNRQIRRRYSPEGNLREIWEYDEEGKQIRRRYGPDGRLLEITKYNQFQIPGMSIEYDGRGKVKERWEYEYDEQGRRIRTRHYGPDGKLIEEEATRDEGKGAKVSEDAAVKEKSERPVGDEVEQVKKAAEPAVGVSP